MGAFKRNYWLSLNKGSVDETEVNRTRAIPTKDVLTKTTVLNEHIGWNYNGVLTGISFRLHGDIWKAVLKAELPSGPKVAYFTGTSLFQLVETVHWYASKAYVSWYHDKKPVRFRKRRGIHPGRWRS